MSFRVNARTVLHLGSELISSDGIAIYELIKNALDANSPVVRLDVVCRMDFATTDRILRQLGERHHPAEWAVPDSRPRSDDWRSLRKAALAAIDHNAPDADELTQSIRSVKSRNAFTDCVRKANFISVDDDGDGMSADTLNDVYLTIGTSNRARQRALRRPPKPGSSPSAVILGEKGLGRLSAMRLGDYMEVITGEVGETEWNRLVIDWNRFAKAADEDISSVPIVPKSYGEKKSKQKGTLIEIQALSSEWSFDKLESLARDHFSKLVDPFSAETLPLEMSFNGNDVTLPAFASFILEHAHGTLEADYRVTRRQPAIRGTMDYRLRGRRSSFKFNTLELASLTEELPEALARVGPFTLQVFWFNRRLLTGIDGIGSLKQVRAILATWAGGVSLYRDGYRVNPYGGPNDDWLDLDRDAFSTSGFKLNRGQIVGRANITQDSNPYLTDQTNREGLTDGPEKRAFVSVLAAVMEHYRLFLVNIDADVRRAERLESAEAISRFRTEDDRISNLLPRLRDALADSSANRDLAAEVEESLSLLRDAADAVASAAEAQAQERNRVMHLASIGLLIEIIAHELYRATTNALNTLSGARSSRTGFTQTTLRVLSAQLKTVQKRLKVLDPLSTNARQVKERFEIVDWVRSIVNGYAARASDQQIDLRVIVRPKKATQRVRAVKGMFVQVLENILANSFYWIVQQHRLSPIAAAKELSGNYIGRIQVTVRPHDSRIVVTDDGPGIPEDRRDLVFQPFFSTKKQKQGKGLGLYIAREIAEYHGGSLFLGDTDQDGNINSILFDFASTQDD